MCVVLAGNCAVVREQLSQQTIFLIKNLFVNLFISSQ